MSTVQYALPQEETPDGRAWLLYATNAHYSGGGIQKGE